MQVWKLPSGATGQFRITALLVSFLSTGKVELMYASKASFVIFTMVKQSHVARLLLEARLSLQQESGYVPKI